MADPLPNEKWNQAFRDLARRRDRQLGPAPALPPARRAQLRTALDAAFSVEAAFREAAAERDRRLGECPLPSAVARELRRRLTRGGRIRAQHFWQARGWPLAASLLAGCGLLFLARHELSPLEAQTSARHDGPPRLLTLRMSAAEMTARRETFLAVDQLSPRKEEGPSGQLRLDLPIQALFDDREIARLP